MSNVKNNVNKTATTTAQTTTNENLLKEIELLKTQLTALQNASSASNSTPLVSYSNFFIAWEYGKCVLKDSKGVIIVECAVSKKGKAFLIDSFSQQSLQYKAEQSAREIAKAKALLGIKD